MSKEFIHVFLKTLLVISCIMFGCVTISFTVHGFDLAAYSADEDSPSIAGTFGLNRKGSSPLLNSIPGIITSMDITATGETLNYNVTQCTGLKISNRSSIHTKAK